MESAQTVLIVKPSSIGDVVMATPMAEALKRSCPTARLTWLVDDRCKDVILGNPYVDEVLVWKRAGGLDGLRSTAGLVRAMRSRDLDVAIDAQGLARSALMAYLSGAKRRVGFAGGREGSSLLYNVRVDCGPPPHDMKSNLKLLEALGVAPDAISSNMLFPLTEDDLRGARELLVSAGAQQTCSIAALAPATTRPNKHWVESRWSELADALHSRFGLTPVFLGSGSSAEMVERIRSQSHVPTVSLVGATTLKLAGAVIRTARLAVAVDTGLMHISVALGVPTVAIFGATSAWLNHAERPSFAVVRKDFPCAPCRKKVTCENVDCMLAVSVDDVAEAAARLLDARPAADRNGKKSGAQC